MSAAPGSHDVTTAFLKAFGVIGASEIGDKTFFIAAVMAMKSNRWQVFAGALGALAAMTVLSALLGWAAPNLIPRAYTHYAATALFLFFGGRMLYDVAFGEEKESELEEVEAELAAAREGRGVGGKDGARNPWADALAVVLSPVFLKAFSLTFVAELGDRSQIATIALAASQDVVGVIVGSIVGHALCTGAAVLGGRYLAASISERTVNLCGGILFLLFGVHSLWSGPPA